jgi:hypothetical protein
LTARGFDQLSAKFTGTSIKVTPGEHNLGIFITLAKRDNETYQLTHPAAHLGGLLRGSLSVTVGDQCYITCEKTKIKTILHYMEEGWLGKTQNRLEGVVFRYDPEKNDKVRIRDVPEKDVLARISGNWKEKISFSLGAKSVRHFPSSPQIKPFSFFLDKMLTGIGTPHSPNRPHPPHGSPQDPPSPLATTAQRESPLLVRRHGSHHRAAVLAGHHPETGTRREAASEGEGEGGERGRVETEVFRGRGDAAWEAGVDGGGQDGVRRVTGGSVGVGGE